ncbi:hypothetical protein EBR43_10440, partial [bacterium]|nr:hypothetical protein [bacterium]
MSEFEKFIYNSYLKVFKTATNSPYKLRKNFSDINDEAFICVKKLASFFKRFPSIDIESFFKAPYKI